MGHDLKLRGNRDKPLTLRNGWADKGLILPRTTERSGRESRDEPRSKFATREPCVACPEQLERGECSELPRREAHQSHGRKYVVRGLPIGLGSWKAGNEQVSGPLVGPRSELPVGRSG